MKSAFNYLFIYPELHQVLKNIIDLLKKNSIDDVVVEFNETLDGAMGSIGNEITFDLSKELVHSENILFFFFGTYKDVYEIEFFILNAVIHDKSNKINIEINKRDEIIIISTDYSNISEDIELFLEPYKEYSLLQKKNYLIYEVGMGLETAKEYIGTLNITNVTPNMED